MLTIHFTLVLGYTGYEGGGSFFAGSRFRFRFRYDSRFPCGKALKK